MKKLIALHIILLSLFLYFTIVLSWSSSYDIENYNCVDMSYEVAPFFHSLGFDTKIIYGKNDHAGHCWLSINGQYFESTRLMFKPNFMFLSKYSRITFVDSYPFGYTDEFIQNRNP